MFWFKIDLGGLIYPVMLIKLASSAAPLPHPTQEERDGGWVFWKFLVSIGMEIKMNPVNKNKKKFNSFRNQIFKKPWVECTAFYRINDQ